MPFTKFLRLRVLFDNGLADLASCQSVHNLPVGLQKVEARQLVRPRPREPFELQISWHSRVPNDLEEQQAHGDSVRIAVICPVHLGANLRVDPQLFRKFPTQARRRRLARLHLSARKLPLQTKPVPGFSLAHEDAVAGRQDSRRDEDHARLPREAMALLFAPNDTDVNRITTPESLAPPHRPG